ncbi:hypothetical protein HDU91_003447, partial [Kappamyces sp. JEL0680]
MQRFAGKMITVSLWISIAMQFVFSGLCFYAYTITKRSSAKSGYLAGGALFLLLGLLWLWLYRYWRVRIPFARVMLKTVTKVISKYPATLSVGIVGLLVQSGWS